MIDPRIAERRRTVIESSARRGVRRAITLLVGVSIVAALIWVLQSPWLSVNEISLTGSDRPDVREAISTGGLEEGTPLVFVRAQKVEAELEALPWVRTASVQRVFPDRVEIAIDQRAAVAWLWTSGSYAILDVEGVVLEYVSTLAEGAPVLQFATRRLEPGEIHSDPLVLGGLQFLAALDGLLPGFELREEAGEVWGIVDGHEIRLGRPVDMPAKAAALIAVLADDIPAGSSINLIAPTRPAVTP
jgi:hypothetical protein